MKRLWLLLVSSGLIALIAGCNSEEALVAGESVERTGYYALVDQKPLAEQAVEWAYAGHVIEMEKLLAKDKKLVNAVVGDFTPLTAALANESGDMVDYLLANGADPNLASTQGTPLGLAEALDVDRDIIDALKAHGAR